MASVSFYLSRVLGNKVYDLEKNPIGKLMDIQVLGEVKNAKVVSIKIKCGHEERYINADYVSVEEKDGQYVLTCSKIEEIKQIDEVFSLGKYILDKQIIDINGRKVVRVNDIRIVQIENGLFVVAVDIGIEGLLRRLGVAKPLKRVLKPLKVNFDSKLVLWDNIATVFSVNENLTLSTSYNKLSTLHPSDLADIIEEFDTKTATEIFLRLDNARAADVLEQMESDTQISILKTLAAGKAADILEEMPPDEVADILDDLDEEDAEELLNNMETDASTEVRELMEYEEDTVGSLMSTDFISLKNNFTAQQTIEYLRELKPEEDNIYYLYVTDFQDKLCGVVSLRNLIIAEPNTTLQNIMQENLISVYDTDPIDNLIKTVSKYNLMAIPVVDLDKVLVGMVILNDVIYELLKGRRR